MKVLKSQLITCLIACVLISSIQVNANSNTINLKLNVHAEQFVKLGLELGQYDKDYVDAYLGPKEWMDHAKKNPRSKEQLAIDISALLKTLKSLKINDDKLAIRHKSLYRNVRAMDVRIRMVNGEKFSFADEARLIYDAVLPKYDFNQFDEALVAIDTLIPGDGPLHERVDAFKETFSIPSALVSQVVDTAIAECRKRSAKYIAMPKNERFTLEYVKDKSWGGYNWYQGDNKSLMQINQDFPMPIGKAIVLGCHEGYPGHHVWNVMIENNLFKANDWVEFSIKPLFSPYGLIAEGSANYGVKLAFPDQQKIDYERDILFPLANLDPEKADALDALNKLTRKLSHARTATAQLYLDGKITKDETIAQLQKYSLISKERATHGIRFIEQYRAYVLNYNLGMDIVASYVERQGDTEEARWQAFENMLSELSTASDMVE